MTDDRPGSITDLITVTGHTAVNKLESYKLAFQALGLLSQEILLVDKITLGL